MQDVLGLVENLSVLHCCQSDL